MMERVEALKTIAEFRTDEIVVVTMSAMKEWPRLSPSPLNLYVGGAMGYASSLGLGVALARPDRRVLVLDGDGSLLMNLGSLVSICDQSPPNLFYFVLENGVYELTGRVALPALGKTSLAGFARATGLTRVYEFDSLGDFRERLGAFWREPGPVFVSLKVAPGPREPLSMPPAFQAARDLERALRT